MFSVTNTVFDCSHITFSTKCASAGCAGSNAVRLRGHLHRVLAERLAGVAKKIERTRRAASAASADPLRSRFPGSSFGFVQSLHSLSPAVHEGNAVRPSRGCRSTGRKRPCTSGCRSGCRPRGRSPETVASSLIDVMNAASPRTRRYPRSRCRTASAVDGERQRVRIPGGRESGDRERDERNHRPAMELAMCTSSFDGSGKRWNAKAKPSARRRYQAASTGMKVQWVTARSSRELPDRCRDARVILPRPPGIRTR